MAITLPDIFEKLLDNANLGKVVTDVGAGFALTVPFLMALGLWTGISVLPADRIPELKKDMAQSEQKLAAQKQTLRDLLLESYRKQGKDASKIPADSDSAYGVARHELADLGARLEVLRDRRKNAGKQPGAAAPCGPGDACDRELTELGSLDDRLAAQKEAVEEEAERLKTLKNQKEDALSFSNNLEVFTNNLSALLTFSVILGVMISQINRLVIVTWLYDRLAKPKRPQMTALIKEGKVKKEDSADLISGYYRYMEGAINMVWPVLLFSAVFPAYANQRLELQLSRTGWFLLGLITAVLLLISGFYSYRDFRKKQEELAGGPEATIRT